MRYDVRAGSRILALGERPWLMGIVNATPDSFSDAGVHPTVDDRVALARELVAAGADLIDVGGESGVTNRPAVAPEEEIERVVPVIERVAARARRPGVGRHVQAGRRARRRIAAGACMVNDVSGLRDPGIADVCAATGAALVIMHTRAEPKRKLEDPEYEDVAADVRAFLRRAHGARAGARRRARADRARPGARLRQDARRRRWRACAPSTACWRWGARC